MTAARLRAGFGRAPITAYAPALAMFGWGAPRNRPLRVAAPLHARALALAPAGGGAPLVYVCCDLGMISESLRRAVLDALAARGAALGAARLMLTATHTHSGPSGLSDYLFYATAGPGYVPAVRDAIADGIADAVGASLAALAPARVWFHEGVVPLSEPVAFNRSVAAYNRNRDVTPVTHERRDEAVDRTLALLRVDGADGRPLGMVTWFGLHGTCVHRDHTAIHPDHKGEAATRVEAAEAARGNPGYVAIFAQTAPADVTPNHRWDAARGLLVGRYDDDFESAAFVGEVQARHATALAARAPSEGRELGGPVQAALAHVDLFDAPVDPRFAEGRAGLRTTAPSLGWTFFGGTDEGQGPLGAVAGALPTLSAWKLRCLAALDADAGPVGAKVPFWELGRGAEGRVFGALRATSPLASAFPEAHARYFAAAVHDPGVAAAPWVPRVAPLQLFRVGDLALAALPFEPTVTSGRRLARAVAGALGPEARRVVVNGYANAYAGYLATPEEYDAQRYEGASTLYGRWALPALCTALASLGDAAREGREPPGAAPPRAPRRVPESRVPVVRATAREEPMPDSPAARLQWFFEELARSREGALAHLPAVFTEDVAFRDPFRDTRGMDDFRVLFTRMFRRYPEVGFTGFRAEGDGARFTLTYDMHLRMAVGPAFVTPMASVARARDGRVFEMHDYYDFLTGLVSPARAVHGLYQAAVRAVFL